MPISAVQVSDARGVDGRCGDDTYFAMPVTDGGGDLLGVLRFELSVVGRSSGMLEAYKL